MRKKFTMLLAAMLVCVGAMAQKAHQRVSHEGWVVTALNEAGVYGNEGGVAFIADDNPATFYHSNWSTNYDDGNGVNKGKDGLQAFMVELPHSLSDLSLITYKGRSDNNYSGWARGVRVYVYETLPTGWPEKGLSSLSYKEKEALLAKDNANLGTAAFNSTENLWANDKTQKLVEFTTPQTGKYVLFVMDSGCDAWLTCSDFQIYQYKAYDGIVEGKPYFLQVLNAAATGIKYVDTFTGIDETSGKTITISDNAVETYFAWDTDAWLISTNENVDGNYVKTNNWCANPQSAEKGKWELFVNDDQSLSILQRVYDGDKDNSRCFVGGDVVTNKDATKLFTDNAKDKAINVKLFDASVQSVTVEYSFTYGGAEKYVQETTTFVGEEWPAISVTLPFGVSAAKPEGVIAEDDVKDGVAAKTIELAVNLPFEVSTGYANATWYALQIRGNKYVVRSENAPYSNSAATPSTEGALWAFVGNPFDGIQVLNKAAGVGFTLGYDKTGTGENIYMKEGNTTWNICEGNGGFVLRQGAEGNHYVHDYNGKLQYWNDGKALTDNGSAFTVVSEAEMIDKATAALDEINATIAAYDGIEATYYVYPQANVDAVKSQLKKLIAPTNMMSALRAKVAIENAVVALGSKSDGPKAGDIVSLKNRQYGDYLGIDASNDLYGGAKGVESYWTLQTTDVDGYYYLYNETKQVYAKPLADANNTKTSVTADQAEAGKFGFKQVGETPYAALHDNHLGAEESDASYLHHSNWDDKKIVRWNMQASTYASHWLVEQVNVPLNVTCYFNGQVLNEYSVSQSALVGTTYTVENPFTDYDKRYMNAVCTVNGNRVDLEGNGWSVPVEGATSIQVVFTEELPFKTSKDFANANWQYLQMNSNGWKYVQKNENNDNTSSAAMNSLGDRALWAFVGDAINGFKILNKGAEGAVLTVDAVTDGTAAYMKKDGDQTWTIEKGNGGFVIRQGATECLNDYGGGGVMKVWNAGASPTGAGSAFRVISASGGVADLKDLCLPGIFTLQAERSPLMYNSTADNKTKLGSGLFGGANVAADANDANQQFMIVESDTKGLYYLYNVGAAKFVDANLNFTECPEPVLSFEANSANPIYPWFVKINGKYVVPGVAGQDGNSLYHTSTPSDDDGKRYRIEYVGDDMSIAQGVSLMIQYADGLIRDVSDLSNDKVYTVYTFDRGKWFYNREQPAALWSTGKSQPGKVDKEEEEKADKFAFLTINGKTYLYSVGAGKFVVKSETQHDGMYYATYSDEPKQAIEFLSSVNGGWFPVVVKLNAGEPNQLAISNSYEYPVVMYNNTADPGNQVRVEVVNEDEPRDFSTVLEVIEEYQVGEESVALKELIDELTTINASLGLESLTTAIAAAQAVYGKAGVTYNELVAAKETLEAAYIDALKVKDIDGFSSNYVYTFVSKRGWMGADATDGVISSATGGADNANFQWAVYTSEAGHSYLYNIGKKRFMGVQTTHNAQMPFSATPQTTDLTFKKSSWADYPIMFSMDDKNAVNNNNAGKMICWVGGWTVLTDGGNNHQVTIVGKIADDALATIATAVELYETRGVAIQALEAAIAAAQAKVAALGEGFGYYSSTDANPTSTLAALVNFKNAITDGTTKDQVEAKTAEANAFVATFSVNLPEAGKFYRFSYDYGADGVKYVQAVASNASGKANAMVLNENQGVESIFYYGDGKLLSYSAGQYVRETGNTRGLQAVGAEAGAAKFEAGSKVGKLYIYAGDSFHANKDGGICFVDHCGSGHPDQAEDKHNFTVEEVTTLPVTVTSAGYATLYAPVALEIPTGVTAYTAKVADAYVSLTKIEGNVIPANTGVMLEADEAVYDFTVTTTDEELASDFVGSLPKANMKDGVRTYTLQNGANGIGFYRFNGTKPINGFRAWVELPLSNGVQSLRIRFADTTEIENVETTDNGQQTTVIYDLSGRRIEKIVEKGMYIVNGKKVIVK